MNFIKYVQDLVSTPTKQTGFYRIPDRNVEGGNLKFAKFERHKDYFEIRLMEMFLKNSNVLGVKYAPLSLAVTQFLYDGENRTVPFVLGNQFQNEFEQYLKGEHVEFRNLRVVGPVPYVGDDVSLFVGLFRCQIEDYSKRLWQFAATVLKAFDPTQLSRYLDIAEPVHAGLSQLFGSKEIQYLTGTHLTFTTRAEENDQTCFREGYWAYVNLKDAKQEFRPSDLWVKDGILMVGDSADSLHRMADHDHCLVRIGRLQEREDYTRFAFHAFWDKAQDQLYRAEKGSEAKARKLLAELMRKVSTCPDITLEQREQLIQAYLSNFEQQAAVARSVISTRSSSTVTTRSGGGAKTPKQIISHMAILAEKGMGSAAVKPLREVSRLWDEIPKLDAQQKGAGLTDLILASQMKAFAKKQTGRTANPHALAEALSTSLTQVTII